MQRKELQQAPEDATAEATVDAGEEVPLFVLYPDRNFPVFQIPTRGSMGDTLLYKGVLVQTTSCSVHSGRIPHASGVCYSHVMWQMTVLCDRALTAFVADAGAVQDRHPRQPVRHALPGGHLARAQHLQPAHTPRRLQTGRHDWCAHFSGCTA